MGRGQKGNLTLKSLLPAASPQGSPAMWEPDILRLKANVSGGPELCQGIHSASWGQGQHRRADPSGPSVPWVAVSDGREHGVQELPKHRRGRRGGACNPMIPLSGLQAQVRLSEILNQVYNQLPPLRYHQGRDFHVQGLVWGHWQELSGAQK